MFWTQKLTRQTVDNNDITDKLIVENIMSEAKPIVSEAKHLDEGKTALQYILVFKGLDEVAKVGEFGAKKYGQFNYKAGSSYMRFLGSCTRHLAAFIRGENVDAESGISHLAHLIYDCLMVLDWIDRGVGVDDRYTEPK